MGLRVMKRYNVKKIGIALLTILLIISTTLGVWGLIPRKAKALTNIELPYTRINADGTPNAKGDYLLYGEYPQTLVTNTNLTNALFSQTGTLPTEDSSQQWTSYGEYLVQGATSHIDDAQRKSDTWYQDVEYNGERYRGIYFLSYRIRQSNPSDPTNVTLTQKRNGYETGNVYWFKYEPIKWRILDKTNDRQALILAENIIDAQRFQYKLLEDIDYWYNGDVYASLTEVPSENPVYGNNYARSDIRDWLNNDFFNLAFNDMQRLVANVATVDNSASTSESVNNPFYCENTQDKVFILSYSEVLNTNYGFSNDTQGAGGYRSKFNTDYTRALGAYDNVEHSTYDKKGIWMVRSPREEHSNHVSRIVDSGRVYDYIRVCDIDGVVPAMYIDLCDHSNTTNCRCVDCGYELHNYTNTDDVVCNDCNYARVERPLNYKYK